MSAIEQAQAVPQEVEVEAELKVGAVVGPMTAEMSWNWFQIFTGGTIQIDQWSTISFEDYDGWLRLAGIPLEFANDPDVKRMHDERRLPPSIARQEFFCYLKKGALPE